MNGSVIHVLLLVPAIAFKGTTVSNIFFEAPQRAKQFFCEYTVMTGCSQVRSNAVRTYPFSPIPCKLIVHD
jgi:hypothetical protein